MASKAEDDLAKVKQLLSKANSQSTSDARRTFYEHLIAICAYPSYDCKAFFGTLVAKHFREFEDLQDKAIDAILDLCEDDEERVRVIGIRGLGATAKADSRWVRGNVGVLLQLLECPPRELRLIHEQLFTLLPISPSDVFAVMLDDMRANEDTSASRKNIIAFLTKDALPRLQKLFDSDDNGEAEGTLQKGLEDLLPSLEPLDQSSILILLGALPKVSGRTASQSSAKGYVKVVTRSIKHGSTSDKTAPYISAMAAYVSRKPPLDPMDGLLFAGDHGMALVLLSLEKRDESAVEVVEKTMEWVERVSRDLGSKDGLALARDIVDGYLRGLKYYGQDHRTYFNDGQSKAAEMVLYTLYLLFLVKDNRRDMISKAHQTALLDIGDEARKLAKSATGVARKELESVYELVRLLENDHKSLPKGVVPSWKAAPVPTPRQSSPPRSSSSIKNQSGMSSLRSSPPRSQPPRATPTQPRAAQETMPKLEPGPPLASTASTSAPVQSTKVEPEPLAVNPPRVAPPTAPRSEVTPSIDTPQANETSVASSQTPSISTTAPPQPVSAPRATTSSLSLSQRISGVRPAFGTDSRTSLSGTELLPGPLTSTPMEQDERPANQSGVELLPRVPGSAPTPTEGFAPGQRGPPGVSGPSAVPVQPRSLVDRLGMGTKRPREEPLTAPSNSTPIAQRSLIDRMNGPLTDTRTPKRPREEVQPSSAPVNGTRSLLSRMSNDVVNSPTLPLPTKPSLSIRQTPSISTPAPREKEASSMAAQKTISILQRASRPPAPTMTGPATGSSGPSVPVELLPGPATPSSAPAQSMSIRARASQPPSNPSATATTTTTSSAPAPPARPMLNIRSSSSGTDDTGIRRRGRGFEPKQDNDGDFVMAPERPEPREPETNGNGFGQGFGFGNGGGRLIRRGAKAFGR